MTEKWNVPQFFDALEGRPLDIIPLTLKNGGSFTRMAASMRNRTLALKLKDEEAIRKWVELPYWTNNPIFYHRNGNVKFGDASDETVTKYLMSINSGLEGQLFEGRMVLPRTFDLNMIAGTDFTRKDIVKYGYHLQTEKDAKKNIILLALADNDKPTLEAYTSQVYKYARDKLGKTKLMDLQFSLYNEVLTYYDQSSMGVVWFGGLGGVFGRSAVFCDRGLDYNYGRVVRVQATEAQTRAPQETKRS